MKRSEVAKFLRTLRRELNMTQNELCKFFKVNHATISKWELGTRPRLESFKQIRKVYENPAELYSFYNIAPPVKHITVDTLKENTSLKDKTLLKEQIEFLQKQLVKLEREEILSSNEAFTVTVDYELRELVYEYIDRECTNLTDYVNYLIREHMDKKVTS